jgi:hypothetical protein
MPYDSHRSILKLFATVCFVAIFLSRITPNTIAAVIHRSVLSGVFSEATDNDHAAT